jgi:predicted DCC family thiol-disulfide oxidoreductase YuxK
MLILYDRDCGFCAWTLARLLRRDRCRALEVATIQGPEGDRRLAHLAPRERLATWHVVDDAGRLHSGGPALVPVLSALPGGAPPAALLARAPRLTTRAYAWVADHRSLLSKPVPAAAKLRARTLLAERSGEPDALRPEGSCSLVRA